MSRATAKQREEFIRTLLEHLPERMLLGKNETEGTREWGWFADGRPFAERLMRYGAILARIAETECNSPNYPDYAWKLPEDERLKVFKRFDERYQRELDRLGKKEERIRNKVGEMCHRFQCKPIFGGDPRGCVLKIQVPDGHTDDWGREGICVPTA